MVEALRSRWKTVVILAVVLPGALVAAGFTVLQRTEASVDLWADGGASSGQSRAQAQADAIAQVTRTGSFAGSLRQALDRANVGTGADDRDRIATGAWRQLTITTDGANLVVVSYPCARPQDCVKTLAAAVDAYMAQALKLQLGQGQQARTALSAQVDDAQNALNQAALALSAYLNAHPGEKPSDTATDPQLDLLQSQVAAARQALTSLQTKLTDLQVSAASLGAVNSLTVVDPGHLSKRGVIGDGGLVQSALTLALGILLAAAYLGVVAARDGTARDPAALERRLQIPLLATIPRFSEMKRL